MHFQAFLVYTYIMKAFLTNLEDHILDLNDTIRRLENNLVRTPNGNITCKKVKNTYRLYKVQHGMPDEYLGKDKEPLIRALAQKRYNKELLNALKWEKQNLISLTNNLNNNLRHKTVKQVWENFPEPLKPYVKQNDWTDEAFIQEWSKIDRKFDYRKIVDKHSSLYTLHGEQVKSKSEILIGDRLYHAGIPYHYEKRLELIVNDSDLVALYPDFTILNTRTLQTWYWEHFGRLHDEKYREEMKTKLDTYGENGIIPGLNLIITMETATNQLSTKYIQNLIDLYLK